MATRAELRHFDQLQPLRQVRRVARQHQRLAFGVLAQPCHPCLLFVDRHVHLAAHHGARVDLHRRRERIAGIRAAGDAHRWRAARLAVPRDHRLVAAGGDGRAVDRAGLDLPAIRVHRDRLGPCAVVLHARDHDVADVVVAAIAPCEQGASIGDRDVGLAAIAGTRIDHGIGTTLQIHVEGVCTQLHRTGVMRAFLLFGARRHVLLASIQPGDADRIRTARPQRGEAVFAFGLVIVDPGDLRPGHAAVARSRQRHVIGRRTGCIRLQPLHPQRTIRSGQQVRRIGPVGDQRLAHRDRARQALPAAGFGVRRELQHVAAALLAIQPADQHSAIRCDAQVRRHRPGLRRQHPVLHDVIAIGRFRDRRCRVIALAGRERGDGDDEGNRNARFDQHVHAQRIRPCCRGRPPCLPAVPVHPAKGQAREPAPTGLRHAARSRRWRSRCTSSSEIAAGVIPGMRCACPTVCGRTRCSFCRASADRPCTCG